MADIIELKPVNKVQNIINKFCYTIGMLPTSYKASMTYEEQLIAIGQYLEETVIPAINNNAEVVAELQDLYMNLKNYVDNYFDNLDVQSEINNKLDEMANDGAFTTLITPIVNQTLNNLTENLENLQNQVEQSNENVNNLTTDVNQNFMNELRYKYYNQLEKIKLPDEFNNSFFNQFPVYVNKLNRAFTPFNPLSKKVSGGTTYYVSPNGSNSNSGTDREHPFQTLDGIFNGKVVDGDTVILMAGMYDRNNYDTMHHINLSVNIIADDGVYMKFSDNHIFTQNEQFTNVYQTSRTSTIGVLDISLKDQFVFKRLTKVDSIQAVSQTEGSWYTDGTNVYLRMFNDIIPNNDNCLVDLKLSASNMSFQNFNKDTTIYLENIYFLNASSGNIMIDNNSEYNVTLVLNKCKLMNNFAVNYSLDGLSNKGANSILYDCICCYSNKDGFNYHYSSNTNNQAQGVEINCKSVSSGIYANNTNVDGNSTDNQASTAHNNCKVLRINCDYAQSYDNNICDINNSITVNVCLNLFDAIGNSSSDFNTQNDAIAYLYYCNMKGSKSKTNLVASNNSKIYVKNCKFDSSEGNIIELE